MRAKIDEPISEMWRCGSVVDWHCAERARLIAAWATMSREGKHLGSGSFGWPVGILSMGTALMLGTDLLLAISIGIGATVIGEVGASMVATCARRQAWSVLERTAHQWWVEVDRRGGDLSQFASSIKAPLQGWDSDPLSNTNASLEIMVLRARGSTSGRRSLAVDFEGVPGKCSAFGALCLSVWSTMARLQREGRRSFRVSKHESAKLREHGTELTLNMMPCAFATQESVELDAAMSAGTRKQKKRL